MLESNLMAPLRRQYFPGGGMSSKFVTRGGMPITMSRINLIQGLGPALQIAEGWTVDLPDEVHTILDERTNETWPTTWFVPELLARVHLPMFILLCPTGVQILVLLHLVILDLT